jgi:hypothetical protein
MNRLRISWIYGVLFLVLSLSASAQPDWTRIGSTGTVDETSPFQVNGPALFHPAGSLTPVVARFNVDNVSGLFPIAPWNTLEMTSQDGSAQGLVIARLFRVPRCSGTPFLVCTVQSTDAIAGPTCTQCTFGASPDFVNNSYYVEVTISRNTAAVTPVLFNLRLF